MYTIILLFIIGLIVGSFLNSVIYRLDDILSIVRTRSHCPKCKTPLRWYDLVPLLSFVTLSAKCRYCKKSISWQYPIVEFGTALLFVLLYLQFGLTSYSIILMLITCLLVVIFVYDLFHQLIPDEIVWSAFGLWLIAYGLSFFIPSLNFYISNWWQPLLGGLISAGIIGIIVWVTRGKGMGIGDIKLALLLGFILGYSTVLPFIFLAFILGSIVGLALVWTKAKKMRDTISFGPFLIAGFYLALFFGPKLIEWYLK